MIRLHNIKSAMPFCLAAVMMLLAGCVHKDIDEPRPDIAKVNVVFDWSKAPNTKAKAMTLYMYPENRDVVHHWFGNNKGGIIKAHLGRHTAVCHNDDDTYSLFTRNHETHEGLEIYTTDAEQLSGQGIYSRSIPRAPGTENEAVRYTPSQCYGAHEREINFLASTQTQTLTLYPEDLNCHYSIIFEDVKNLKNADLRIDGTISSMAGGYYPGRLSPTEEAVTHAFTLSANQDLTELQSHFLTFGVPAGDRIPHMICIYIVLKSREGNYYTYDVSDQVNDAPDPRNVVIRIKGLELPEIPDPDPYGGMGVNVDDWHHVYIDLPMGGKKK